MASTPDVGTNDSPGAAGPVSGPPSNPGRETGVLPGTPPGAGGTPSTPEADAPAGAYILISGKGIEVDVSITQQKVRVFKDGVLLREMVASTGVPEKPTPLGKFKIENRGEWFWSDKYKQGGFYWVSFKNRGEYLFHSVPTDKQKKLIPEEAAKLGQPASHGCIRLALEDAKWFYESVPEGSNVYIHR